MAEGKSENKGKIRYEKIADMGAGLIIAKVPAECIREQDINARIMKNEMQRQLTDNIRKRGQLESLPLCALTQDGNRIEIISGHHRIRSGKDAGIKEFWVILDVSGLSRSKIVAKQIAHNAISGFDDQSTLKELAKMLEDVDDMIESYAGTDGKLQDYTKITQMQSAIQLAADKINMSVNSKVYYNYCTNGSFLKDCSGWVGTSLNGTSLANRKIYTYKEKTCAYIGGVELNCPSSASWKFELENDLPIEIALKVALYSLGNKENNSVEIRLDGTAVKTVSRADLSVQWTEIETDVVNMKKGFHTLQIYPTKNSVNGGIYITDIGIYAYRSDQAEAKFSVLSDSISSEITRAKDAEKELSSKITQTASSISTKVEKDGIISAINQTAEKISINANKINLNGAVTANKYFQIKKDGSFAANKGTIGEFTIDDGKISTGSATLSANSHAFVFNHGVEIRPGTSEFSDGSDDFKVFNLKHVTSGGHMVFGSNGVTVSYLSSSSKRYKEHVAYMTLEEAEKILSIPVAWFIYKVGYLSPLS